MIDSKYVTTLRQFNEKELKEFEKWLTSPWCTSNKSLLPLFKTIKKFYPKFLFSFSDEEIFLRAFPKKHFTYNVFRNLLSHSYQAIEAFLIHQHLKKEPHIGQEFLAKEFSVRKNDTFFYKTLEKTIGQINGESIKDWEDYLNLMRCYKMAYNYPSPNTKIPDKTSITEINNNLDIVYILEKASVIKEQIVRNRILKNENYDTGNEIKKWMMVAKDTQHPSVDLYKIRFNKNNDNLKEEYTRLLKAYKKRFEELNFREQQDHLFSLLNDFALLRRLKLGTITEQLDLYKFGFDTGTILINGQVSPSTYSTVLSYSLIINDYDYAQKFVNKYTNFLPSNIRQDGKSWALSRIEYQKGNLNESLKNLQSHDFKSAFFQSLIKLLNFQIYFDLVLADHSYYTYFISYTKNYERWVAREKSLSKSRKNSSKNLIQKGRELLKLYFADVFEKDKVTSILDDVKLMDAPKWFKSKQEQIIVLKTKGKNT